MAAANDSETIKTAEIARALGTAYRYLEPSLQALARAGILTSIRGPGGGYSIGRPFGQINLSEILSSVATYASTDVRVRNEPSIIEIVVSQADAEFRAKWLGYLRSITIADLLKRDGDSPMAVRPLAQ